MSSGHQLSSILQTTVNCVVCIGLYTHSQSASERLIDSTRRATALTHWHWMHRQSSSIARVYCMSAMCIVQCRRILSVCMPGACMHRVIPSSSYIAAFTAQFYRIARLGFDTRIKRIEVILLAAHLRNSRTCNKRNLTHRRLCFKEYVMCRSRFG